MRVLPFVPAGCLAFLLAGCSAADLVNLVTPRSGYSVQELAYGSGARQTMDLYTPDKIAAGSPVVVFVYGGNWDSGEKGDYLFAGQAFASRGYVTAIPNYRVYPESVFRTSSRTLPRRWPASARIATARRIAPSCWSAIPPGAHIALLLALDSRYLADAGAAVCNEVAGAVGLAGPYDFLPLKEDRYRQVFPAATQPASQPIAFADGRDPPVLLLTGDADEKVDPGNSARLAAKIRSAGGAVQVKTYEGISHTGLVGALAKPFRGRASWLDDIDAFIRKHSGDASPVPGAAGSTPGHAHRDCSATAAQIDALHTHANMRARRVAY
jgi:acetyl esterase/lipase